MKAPWPAPPAFAVAAFGTLVQTRNDWQIYGGNIASTLAGEFSFTIGLAFALFGLGRARVHARHREAALAPGGADRAGDHVAHRRRHGHRACSRCCCSSPGGAAEVIDLFLLGEQVDHRVRRLRVHLRRVRALEPEHVP